MAEKIPIEYANLKNKSFIITGGASGLGLATGTRFAEHGAYVTLTDLNEKEGKAAEADLTSKGYQVTFVQSDTTNWESSVKAFKHAVNFSPRKTLDGAFLYAGLGGDPSNFVKMVERDNHEVSLDKDPVESSTKVLNVNLNGVIRTANLALHYFRLPAAAQAPPVAEGKKVLFLCASLAGYIDYDPTIYSVSKYGVRGLFRSLRIASRLEDSIFTCNVVCPGYTQTPMVTKGEEGSRKAALDQIGQMGLWAPVENVVSAAALCATRPDAVNGRSFGTWPHGFYDQMEDLDEYYGGKSLLEHADKSGYRNTVIS